MKAWQQFHRCASCCQHSRLGTGTQVCLLSSHQPSTVIKFWDWYTGLSSHQPSTVIQTWDWYTGLSSYQPSTVIQTWDWYTGLSSYQPSTVIQTWDRYTGLSSYQLSTAIQTWDRYTGLSSSVFTSALQSSRLGTGTQVCLLLSSRQPSSHPDLGLVHRSVFLCLHVSPPVIQTWDWYTGLSSYVLLLGIDSMEVLCCCWRRCLQVLTAWKFGVVAVLAKVSSGITAREFCVVGVLAKVSSGIDSTGVLCCRCTGEGVFRY